MEHGTTEEERTLNAVARMNLRIKEAYSQQHKISQTARTQLFSIPRTRRIHYKPATNERWLELVSAAVCNRKRQNEKLHESLRKITSFYVPKKHKNEYYQKSKQARSFQSPTYTQLTIRSYYNTQESERNKTPNKKQKSEHLPQLRVEQRKTKNPRITTFFNRRPD